MLKAKSLQSVLRAALAGGVETALLLADRGNTVLASAATNPAFPRSPEHALLVATIGNLWRAYATNDLASGGVGAGPSGGGNDLTSGAGPTAAASARPKELDFLLVTAGDRRLCILALQPSDTAAAGELLLCLSATAALELGMLKLRAASLKAHLEGQLKAVGGPSVGVVV